MHCPIRPGIRGHFKNRRLSNLPFMPTFTIQHTYHEQQLAVLLDVPFPFVDAREARYYVDTCNQLPFDQRSCKYLRFISAINYKTRNTRGNVVLKHYTRFPNFSCSSLYCQPIVTSSLTPFSSVCYTVKCQCCGGV